MVTAQSCIASLRAISGKYKALEAVCFRVAVLLWMMLVVVVIRVASTGGEDDDSLSSSNFEVGLTEAACDTSSQAHKHSHC